MLILVAAACSTPTTSPGLTTPGASEVALGSGQTPTPTRWPSSVVEAVVALGAADGDLGKAGSDLNSAVQSGDGQRLLRTSSDVLAFLTGNRKNIPALQSYPDLKPLGDKLAPAYDEMIAGVTKIHDSLLAGDASGVTAGFQQFAHGSTLYGDARAELGDRAEQAIFMKKGLLR